MLFTGKGDKGTSKLFNTPSGERLSKSSPIFETLGALDELNSYLGLCKAHAIEGNNTIESLNRTFADVTFMMQKDLFIVQAEFAGADMSIGESKVAELTDITNKIETEMPEIKSFFIPGATHTGAHYDIARTLARRAERRAVAAIESGATVSEHTLAYLNRLSSVLYALARLCNHYAGICEEAPDYR